MTATALVGGRWLATLLVGIALALGAALAAVHSQVSELQGQVTALEHACGPANTGGGVVQCTQPDALEAPATP